VTKRSVESKKMAWMPSGESKKNSPIYHKSAGRKFKDGAGSLIPNMPTSPLWAMRSCFRIEAPNSGRRADSICSQWFGKFSSSVAPPRIRPRRLNPLTVKRQVYKSPFRGEPGRDLQSAAKRDSFGCNYARSHRSHLYIASGRRPRLDKFWPSGSSGGGPIPSGAF